MYAILILIQIQLSDTVQICSIHGCHPDTHSDSNFRYAPDTDAILILIQIQSSDTVQIHYKHGRHSDTYSVSAYRHGSTFISGWHLQAHLQQLSIISPNGIFKLIPYKPIHHPSSSANFWAL